MKIYILVSLVAFYISCMGFTSYTGRNGLLGLIPGLNIYYFFKYLGLNWIAFLIVAIALAIPISRTFTITLLVIFFPFMASFSKRRGIFCGILTLLFPVVMYPLLAFFLGEGDVIA